MSKKIFKEEILLRFYKIHNTNYNYENSNIIEPVSTYQKIDILCKTCNQVFNQAIYAHARGQGCPNCFGTKKKTTEEFIKLSKEKFGNKFDYSKTIYVNKRTKVTLICPIHGEFLQTPIIHLKSPLGCPKCYKDILKKPKVLSNKITRFTRELFIQESKKLYPNNFNYDKLIFNKMSDKILLTCNYHTDFYVYATEHLNPNILRGCPYCQKRTIIRTKDMFIWEAEQKFNNKYNYKDINYIDFETPIEIKCDIHGIVLMTPKSHLKSPTGCSKCSGTVKLTTKEFIEKSIEIHGNEFDYSKVDYINNKTKVIIICPKKHKFLIKPNNHMLGQGCSICAKESQISKAEINLNLWFQKEFNIDTIQSYRPDWMSGKELDIFIPELNLAIEYNGYAFHKSEYIGIKDNFLDEKLISKNYHEIKYNLCKENGIDLIHIFEFENLEKWKRKLKLYFENPNKFEISFKNEKRSLIYSNRKFIYYGQSFIKIR